MKTSKTILRFILFSGALIFSCCDVPVDYNNPFDPNVGILPPSGLKIDSTSETFVALSWKNNFSVADPGKMSLVRTVVEYAFEKDSKGRYIFQPVDTVSGSTSSVTVIRLLEQANFHAFVVFSILGSHPTVYSNVVGTDLHTQPIAPSNIGLTLVSTNYCDVVWKDNTSSELYFEIERKVSASGNFARIVQVPANTTRFRDSTVIDFAGDTLYYRVRAVLPNGYFTPFSAASIYYPFAPPTSLKATNKSRTSIQLTWNSNVPFGSGFVVERAEKSGSFVEIGRTNFSNVRYTDSPPDTTMEYSYRIRMSTGTKQSDPSGSVLVGWWPELVSGSMTSLLCYRFGGTSPDGSLLVLVSYPGNLQVLSSSGYQILQQFQNGNCWVNSVDIDKNNEFIVAGLTDDVSNTGKVKIWRLSDGSLFKEWEKPNPVRAVKFSPDGSNLATDGDSGSITLLDFKEHRMIRTFEGSSPVAFSTPSSAYPQTLIAARNPRNQLAVWDMNGWPVGGVYLESVVIGPTDGVSNLRFFKEGRTLLSVVYGWIVLGDIYGSYPTRKYHGTLCEITADDQYLVGSSDYGLFVIRVSNWSVTSIVPLEFPSEMALLPGGRVLFSEDGVKQYYLQNRWTSALSDPDGWWMSGSTSLQKRSKSSR